MCVKEKKFKKESKCPLNVFKSTLRNIEHTSTAPFFTSEKKSGKLKAHFYLKIIPGNRLASATTAANF